MGRWVVAEGEVRSHLRPRGQEAVVEGHQSRQGLLGAAAEVEARPCRQEEAEEEAGREYPWHRLAEVGEEVEHCHLGAEEVVELLWQSREEAAGAEALPSGLPLPWFRARVSDPPLQE